MRKPLPVLVAIAALLGLSATAAAPATTPPRTARCAAARNPALPYWARQRSMTVINDSVLLSGEAALKRGMPCWHINLIGRPALMLRAAESQIRTSGRHVAPLVVLGVGYNSLWERHRLHYASWAARFDGDAARLLHTLRKAGAEQFVWVTLRHADRANTSSNHWGELNLYAWYFPYVNERLHLLDAQRNRLVLADWAHLGDRRGVTYDSIHLNSTGGHLMQLLIEKTIYREAHRQAASGATP